MIVLIPYINLLKLSWKKKSIFEDYRAFSANREDPNQRPFSRFAGGGKICLNKSYSLVYLTFFAYLNVLKGKNVNLLGNINIVLDVNYSFR